MVRVELRTPPSARLPNVRLLPLTPEDCRLARPPNKELLLLRLYIGSLCCEARLPNERLLLEAPADCWLARPPKLRLAFSRFMLEELLLDVLHMVKLTHKTKYA